MLFPVALIDFVTNEKSRVAVSGIRSNASAKHISATPSCEESENS
jgi:hypothetical protein